MEQLETVTKEGYNHIVRYSGTENKLRLLVEGSDKQKAQKLLNLTPSLKATIRESKTYVGGGTMPNKTIPTIVIEIEGNATSWEKKFRKN